MARLIAAWVRHGEYEQPDGVPSAHLPHPLTLQGERQAEEVGAGLLRFAREIGARASGAVHTSRMLRAWQTAIRIRDAFHATGIAAEVVQTDSLAERSVGCLANLTISEIESIALRDPRVASLHPNWKSRSDFRLPFQGAESLIEAGERVAAYVDGSLSALAADVRTDTLVAFVGHGGAFRHAALRLGALAREEVPHLSMYHCQPVFLERLAPGVWKHIGGEWKRRSSHARHCD